MNIYHFYCEIEEFGKNTLVVDGIVDWGGNLMKCQQDYDRFKMGILEQTFGKVTAGKKVIVKSLSLLGDDEDKNQLSDLEIVQKALRLVSNKGGTLSLEDDGSGLVTEFLKDSKIVFEFDSTKELLTWAKQTVGEQ